MTWKNVIIKHKDELFCAGIYWKKKSDKFVSELKQHFVRNGVKFFTRLQKYFISNVTVLEKCQYFTPLYFALIKSLVFQDCLNS